MLELKRKYKKGRKGRREKKVRYMLEIPGNKMAKLHFMVIRVTSRQFAVRGMPAETIAINKPVPSFLLWFIMIRLIVRLLFMGEPELVSRDFKSFKSLSLSLSFRFVLVENANLIARRAISGLSSIRFDQTRACPLDFPDVLVVEWPRPFTTNR